ncbi:MAG: VCBS repeat-containing protein [Planctomycetes bacterium]|nr:VCBS repeat-containing protein [Planctomycetota bacterium]
MLPFTRRLAALGFLAAVFAATAGTDTKDTRLAEDTVRVLVRVSAVDIGRRQRDEAPAEFRLCAVDFDANRRLDPASLRVVRCEAGTGKALSEPLPFRWYDDAIPYDFLECEQNVHATDGLRLQFVSRPRWGDFYNLLGEGKGGRLVWLHTQEARRDSWYAISFRLLPKGRVPDRLAPRGFVGDGSHRCAPLGHSTTGVIHSRVAVADWDGDGLPDLLLGGSRGHVLYYRNRGTKTSPAFPHGQLVLTDDGKPLDVGWGSAPLAVDWDGDGVTDLLCGAERNRILFFKNVGTNRAPRLVNRGFVTADGKPLALPVAPVPKSPPGVYELDYYPVLEAVDWDGDGRLDLLAGGVITGRIYFYKNVGKNADGTPKLTLRGPLEADGKPLNVGDWAAAPCAADFDGDGDLDLISGNMPMTAGGGDSVDAEHFLRYWENVGTRTRPRLVERPFPKVGRFPRAALGTPRAVDVNGDGLLDLVVSAGENVYVWLNVGTKKTPKFAVDERPLPGEWSSAPLPTFGVQFIDWNGDGRPDILSGLTVHLNQGGGEYRPESLLPPGNRVDHSVPRGDDWTFTHLADLDGDGRLDLLYGTHEGHVWRHRNLGGKPPRFDEKGEQLRTKDGPIRVGPRPGQKMDFDVLQGARTTLTAADFDGDGLVDLVVGDTYGKVRFYRNLGTKKEPRFAAADEIGDLKIRMIPYAADWDGDGRIDVVGSSAAGEVVLYRNLSRGKFAAGVSLRMPAVPYGPFAAVVDWNGDGDPDLIVGTAYGYFCWFERSFLERGYARAERVGARSQE